MSVNLDRYTAPVSVPIHVQRQMSQDSLKHRNAPEGLGRVLERVLQVLQDGLLLDRLLNLALRLDAEGVRFEEHAFALGLELGFVLPLARLADELRKLRGIVLGGVR